MERSSSTFGNTARVLVTTLCVHRGVRYMPGEREVSAEIAEALCRDKFAVPVLEGKRKRLDKRPEGIRT